jgi:dTDP-4-dehydrorhamnose reductase
MDEWIAERMGGRQARQSTNPITHSFNNPCPFIVKNMILLLGATGYIGEAFAAELQRRKSEFVTLSRTQAEYTRFDSLLEYLRAKKPAFVINCAGFTGKPNVDACELDKAGTLLGNTLLPQTIAHACAAAGIPWGHISSGCIYSGAKISEGGTVRVEKDMNKAELHALAESKSPSILGFTEVDMPNFSFRDGPCSFYSGSKALGEEVIANIGQSYVWRLRIPFDEFDNKRNYLSKVQRYQKVYENVNSVSHRADFVRACLDTWERRVPFGIYNVTNPGYVTTRHVVELIEKHLKLARKFEFWKNDDEFYKIAAKTPRSNCVMDVTKLLATGVKIRPVEEALEDSLKNWKPE